jgi:hypothetical protein
MDKLLSRITPGQVSWFAKVFALLVAFALTLGYVTATLTVQTAGIGTFFLSVGLLLALPGQRSSELLGALAIWMTYAEFMSAFRCGHFDLWRWAVALATLALVVVPLKVQHLRQMARSNPYQPILELDRRIWSAAGPEAVPAPYVPAALAGIRTDDAGPDMGLLSPDA